jgi:hypothetical protein
LAAGSIVLPSSIRVAQASPFSDVSISSANEARIDCEFYGPVDIYVHSTDGVPLEELPLPIQ